MPNVFYKLKQSNTKSGARKLVFPFVTNLHTKFGIYKDFMPTITITFNEPLMI